MNWFFKSTRENLEENERVVDITEEEIATVAQQQKEKRSSKPKIKTDIEYITDLHEITQECVINTRDSIKDWIELKLGGDSLFTLLSSFIEDIMENINKIVEVVNKQSNDVSSLVKSHVGLIKVWNEKFVPQFSDQSESMKELKNSVDQLILRLDTVEKTMDIIEAKNEKNTEGNN